MIWVGFSASSTLVSYGIRLLTGSDVSHTFLIVADPLFDQLMVMEAIDKGVSYVPLKVFRKRNDIKLVLEAPVPLETSLQRASSWLGERYAYAGLAGMLIVQAGLWLKRRWHNPIHQMRALFCSEMVAFVAQDAGWPGARALDAFSTNPEELKACLQASGRAVPVPG